MIFNREKSCVNQSVLVLGGNGFIGCYIVNSLLRTGVRVVVGSRYFGSQTRFETRQVRLEKINSNQQALEIVSEFDVVINAVGILRERGNATYQQVHHHAVAHLAHACARRNIRFVHISALGIDNPVRSLFSLSKRFGERSILNAGGDCFVIRASLVDGPEGYGARWFRRLSAWPVHFSPSKEDIKIAPLDVRDLAEATIRIALASNDKCFPNRHLFEVGGKRAVTVFEYLELLKGKPPLLRVRVPSLLARLLSHILDMAHWTPFSFGHYELLQYDNYPKNNDLPCLLGRGSRLVHKDSQDRDNDFIAGSAQSQ